MERCTRCNMELRNSKLSKVCYTPSPTLSRGKKDAQDSDAASRVQRKQSWWRRRFQDCDERNSWTDRSQEGDLFFQSCGSLPTVKDMSEITSHVLRRMHPNRVVSTNTVRQNVGKLSAWGESARRFRQRHRSWIYWNWQSVWPSTGWALAACTGIHLIPNHSQRVIVVPEKNWIIWNPDCFSLKSL